MRNVYVRISQMPRFNQLFDILCSSTSLPVNKTLNERSEYKCSETGITVTKGVHSNKSKGGGRKICAKRIFLPPPLRAPTGVAKFEL